MRAFKQALAVLILISGMSVSASSQVRAENLSVSVLTCTPGTEIYSLFGHTAIRVRGTINGKAEDWVYNYGTFEWTDDFPIKFARGKLMYQLSRSPFYAFNHTYIEEQRGIVEQHLGLDEAQKGRLFQLLEENYLPDNRKYLYDFFYDNCATRVIDILEEALGDDLVFNYETPDSTFRDMIDIYLEEWHWTDLGIDLGLGLPSDKKLEKLDDAFLPDFLYAELASATLAGVPLVVGEEELLLAEDEEPEAIIQPLLLFSIILFAYLALTFLQGRMSRIGNVLDYVFLTLSGIVGVFLLLLWFATDHTTTANNLNLLWAMPLNLVMIWFRKETRVKYFRYYALLVLIVCVTWMFGPQDLNTDILPFALALLFAAWRVSRR